MAACATDHFEPDDGISRHAPHDRRHLLATLGAQAADEVGAGLLTEMVVISVVRDPDPTDGRVNRLVNAGLRGAGRQLGQPVLPRSQEPGSRWTPWRSSPLPFRCDQVRKAFVSQCHCLSPDPNFTKAVQKQRHAL